jgi:hypothetical protein
VAILQKANICAEKMGSRWVVYGYGGAVIDSGSRYGLVPYISFGNDVLDGKNAIGPSLWYLTQLNSPMEFRR